MSCLTVDVCSNASLGLCQCEKDEWKAIQKGGIWSSVMSPYDKRYVDVKFAGEVSGSVSVAVEEGMEFLLTLNTMFNFLHITSIFLCENLCRSSEMAPPMPCIWIYVTVIGTNCQRLGSFLL